MAESAVHLVISGRVQGVGFRAWASHEARRRGLRGWVRNRHDGGVEALLIGDGPAVEAMIEACWQGPSMARVDDIARSSGADDGSPGFAERHTV
ncbi:MAG TPA: acylphosphatase [Stellaceae bacterium]|nr:acylphosphatase [Stellaceae bacterium]